MIMKSAWLAVSRTLCRQAVQPLVKQGLYNPPSPSSQQLPGRYLTPSICLAKLRPGRQPCWLGGSIQRSSALLSLTAMRQAYCINTFEQTVTRL
ncbi:hypothetical protein WJX79_002858 [Trebouxia sp. C0005]